MLRIILSDGNRLSWRQGEDIPQLYQPCGIDSKRQDVIEIQASNEELDSILELFRNLPQPRNKNTTVWHGDMAKFIFHNFFPS